MDVNGKQLDVNGKQVDVNGKQVYVNGKQVDVNCVEMISRHSKTFDEASADEEYSAMINRGGLCKPSDIIFVTCLHAYAMWYYIRNDSEIYSSFTSSRNQRNTFNERQI